MSPVISGGGGAGGSGIGALLFSSVLAAPAATIDTGAGGIAITQNALEVFMYLRTDEAAVTSLVKCTLNNDASAIYDTQVIQDANVTLTQATAIGGTSWLLTVAGATAEASLFATITMRLPAYAGTTGLKAGVREEGLADSTAANMNYRLSAVAYRSATAISRLAITPNTAGKNFVTGSAVYIFGR